jgi:hypothetical protein
VGKDNMRGVGPFDKLPTFGRAALRLQGERMAGWIPAFAGMTSANLFDIDTNSKVYFITVAKLILKEEYP